MVQIVDLTFWRLVNSGSVQESRIGSTADVPPRLAETHDNSVANFAPEHVAGASPCVCAYRGR